jgi:hypothetical protein
MRLLRFGSSVFCAFGLGGLLRAADPPPPTNAGTATAAVSLDDIRRALETAPPTLPPGGSGGPSEIIVPPIQLAPGPASPAPAKAKAGSGRGSATQSSNHWLLDAMRQPDANGQSTDGTGATGDPRDAASSSGDLRDEARGLTSGSDDPAQPPEDSNRAKAKSADSEPPASLPNPFAGFMSSWLSPDDAALLTKEATLAGSTSPPAGPPTVPSGGESALGPASTSGTTGPNPFTLGDSGGAAPGPVEPAPNPYLEILSPPPDLLIPGGALLSDQIQLPAPIMPPPAPIPLQPTSPPAAPPNFVPPPLEDKQLPQLKRF